MIYFYLKESFNSIRKAKLSFLLSLSITCIAVFLVSLSFILLSFSGVIEEKIKERITLNVFLNDSLSNEKISGIQVYLNEIKIIKSLEFISKEEAEKTFIDQTGNDFKNLLDYNPLPSSFEIKLRSEFVNEESINKLEKSIKKFSGVSDVVIQSSLIKKLLDSLRAIKLYILLISIFFFLVSTYIVYSTNRLIIQSKFSQLEAMKLVGAKISTIKIPLLISGMAIGTISSLLTILTIKLLSIIFKNNFDSFLLVFINNPSFFISVIISGILIGLIGSIIATSSISHRINKIIL
ncbi:MAG: permease-like cell division protein FtsX [Ignavibacteriales bacterium]|nr:permease-like cell division protein FtsX [Ignavibacteriales bacterium]